jgi:hypothetical protein
MARNELGRGWHESKKPARSEETEEERAEREFFERIGEHDKEVEGPELLTE